MCSVSPKRAMTVIDGQRCVGTFAHPPVGSDQMKYCLARLLSRKRSTGRCCQRYSIVLTEKSIAGQDKTVSATRMDNVAVVGCGYWGKNLIRNFSQLGVLRIFCDSNEPALKTQAALYPQVQATNSFEQVLNDPSIRAVVLATPAAMHFEQCRAALNAGKDVFVEKPLALHLREGRELVELAQGKTAILMVGHILEYHHDVAL